MLRKKLTTPAKPDTDRVDGLRRRVRELDNQVDGTADRLFAAPEDLMDGLAPKLTAVKNERERVRREPNRCLFYLPSATPDRIGSREIETVKSRQQIARKPASKYANLQKQKANSKKKTGKKK